MQNDDVAVAELATSLGYESEAAFSRAFKRVVGVTPGTVRRIPRSFDDGAVVWRQSEAAVSGREGGRSA
ncbi:helix-turn-helix domain-containing protein [Nonomuraea sp. 3N208]|uniref:helix-turn-helix domain-containing protein n=1 Tax=Nonomuraea sp. 3N208 TaxID=3457421 RepID=UPI003FCCAF7F